MVHLEVYKHMDFADLEVVEFALEDIGVDNLVDSS